MKNMLARLSVSAKINAPIVVLALVLCGSSVWLSRVLLQTDAGYAEFLERDVKAQANVLMGRVLYNRLIGLTFQQVLEDEPERMKSLVGDLENRFMLLNENFDKAEKLVPGMKPTLDSLRGKIGAMYAAMKSAAAESLANRDDVAKKILGEQVEPFFPKIIPEFDELQKQRQEAVEEGADNLHANSETTSNMALVTSFAIAVLMFAAAYMIGRLGITSPLTQQIKTIDALCQNDLSVTVEGMTRGDEIGNLARAASAFRDNLVRVKEMEAEKAESDQRNARQRKADMERLANEFQRAVGGIVDAVANTSSQLEGAASSLQRTAGMTQQLSSTVASASEETSVNVQGVAAASEQLASTVSEIGRQVNESTAIAEKAVTQATATNECVTSLSEAAGRIGEVVNLINTIAGQTNLLALNATIEAARAGDAGKGFAVVAQEVKALASQTAKATSEIGAQIASMQSATEQAVTAIQDITLTINRMSEISGAIAAAVEEQDATTKEISRNVLEAAKGTSEVASNITEVSSGATETGSASAQVLASAKQLSSESGNLRRQVENFISTVRAA